MAFSIVSGSVLSPTTRMCSPNLQTSPSALTGFSGGSGSYPSSSAIGSPVSMSNSSKPNASMSMSIDSSSSFKRSSSHSASSAVLLSAKRNALICSSVKSSAMITGTLSKPSLLEALNLVWPAIISPLSSATIGTLKPNCLMLSATASTASSFLRGLFPYGCSSLRRLYVILTSFMSFRSSPCRPLRCVLRPFARGCRLLARYRACAALYGLTAPLPPSWPRPCAASGRRASTRASRRRCTRSAPIRLGRRGLSRGAP